MHLHECDRTTAALDTCKLCGTVFVRRDEGPLSAGYCDFDCYHGATGRDRFYDPVRIDPEPISSVDRVDRD
ncbi:MAG: hypothetical protein HKN46_09510 [Acidimicrobiia bacterium]|nr:hypothetical protein [Acidimicrobiia bacterium]